MVSAKVYELTFYRPFLYSMGDNGASTATSPPPPSLNQSSPTLASTHTNTQSNPNTSPQSSSPALYNFLQVPTIEQIAQEQCFDVESATIEFLHWTGLNPTTTPYTQQLTQLLGVDLILSWKHAISNIVFVLKHSFLTLNINFIIWVYQSFFPPHLYGQIPKSVAINTLKTLSPKPTAIQQAHAQENPPNDTNPDENTSPHLPGHQFLLSTRAIIIGAFITHVPEVALEQYYYTQRLKELSQDEHLFDLVLKSSKHLLPPSTQNDENDDDVNIPLSLSQSNGFQNDAQAQQPQPQTPQQTPDNGSERSSLGNSTAITLYNSTTNTTTPNPDTASPIISRRLQKSSLSSSSTQPIITANPQLLVDSNSDSDVSTNYDNDSGDDFEDSTTSAYDDDDDDRGFKLVGRLHRMRTKQAQKRKNRLTPLQERQKKLQKDSTPTNAIQRHKVSHQPQIGTDVVSPRSKHLLQFYMDRLTLSVAVYDVLYHMFQFTFTLPAHLITLALCASLYDTAGIQTALSNFGLKPIVAHSDEKWDIATILPIFGFTPSQHQTSLKRVLLQQQQQQQQQQQTASDLNGQLSGSMSLTTHHIGPRNGTDNKIQHLINPTFPPRYNTTSAHTHSTIVSTNLAFAFASQSTFIYRQHFNILAPSMVDAVLKLTLTRGLDPIITLLYQLQHNNNQSRTIVIPTSLSTSHHSNGKDNPSTPTASQNQNQGAETSFTAQHFANYPPPVCTSDPTRIPSPQQQQQQQQLEQTKPPQSVINDILLPQSALDSFSSTQNHSTLPSFSLLPTNPPPNPTYLLLEMVTSTNRCTLPSIDNYITRFNPIFSFNTTQHHFHSNIILAIVTSPYLSPTNRAVLFNYFITLATQHYNTQPVIGIDTFMMIIHSVWSLREICPPPYQIINYIFHHLLDRQSWSRRFHSNPDLTIANILNTLKVMFGVEMETPTRRMVITSDNVKQIQQQRDLMLEIYRYIFPPDEFMPASIAARQQNNTKRRGGGGNGGDGGPTIHQFFANPKVIQNKALRDALLSPIFTVGSHQTLLYLIHLGYRLDPFDFVKLLSHGSKNTDYRDCVNIYSIMRSFYLHLYIIHAKSNAVNMIELGNIEAVEAETFSMEKTIQRNRSGFEKFVAHRLPAQLFDRKLLGLGLQLSETTFQDIIRMTTQGNSFVDNTPVQNEEEFMQIFQDVQQAYQYVPSSPEHFQYLICDLSKQAQSTGDRLDKITHYTQKRNNAKEGDEQESESDTDDDHKDDQDEDDFWDGYSDEDEDEDEDEDDWDSDEDEDEEGGGMMAKLRQHKRMMKMEKKRQQRAAARAAKRRTTKSSHKKPQAKIRQRDIYVIDPLIFEALNHYHTHICQSPETQSTMIEFILIFQKGMENFLSHFIGSLLFYRASYSLQSPIMYNILRCLLPRLDLYPAQMSLLMVDKFNSFNLLQQFNLQSLIDSYLEDIICATLALRPTEVEYLLTPPNIAVQLYQKQQQRKKERQLLDEENQAQSTIASITNSPVPPLDNTDQSSQRPSLAHLGIEGTQLEALLRQSQPQLTEDDYDLVTMPHDEREGYRIQISRLIQAMLMCIIIQHKEKHPKSAEPNASLATPQLCFDSFRPFFHFLKYIPLPSVTLYPNRVKSFNYGIVNDNGELLQSLGPSKPGIQPQFLHFMMQHIPTTSTIFWNELFDLYIEQNGPVFSKAIHQYGLVPAHLFVPTTLNLDYYRHVLHTLVKYNIPIATFIDSMWHTLPVQAFQHNQFVPQQEIEFVQFIFSYMSQHQRDVDQYRLDYHAARLDMIETDRARKIAELKAQQNAKDGEKGLEIDNNSPLDKSRQSKLRSRLDPKWNLKSLKQVQHYSQTTDIAGTNLVFWLTGMGISPRMCLSVLYILDHFLYNHDGDQKKDDALTAETPTSNSTAVVEAESNPTHQNEPSSTPSPQPSALTSLIQCPALTTISPDTVAHNLTQAIVTTSSNLSNTHLDVKSLPSTATKGPELTPNETKQWLYNDIYQEHGPNLLDLPPQLRPVPSPRFDLQIKSHGKGTEKTPPPTTSAAKLPIAPFEALFHKDHSGKTILHHLVESTEITAHRLESFQAAAVDPFEQRNFMTLFSTISNQAIPYMSPLPDGIDPQSITKPPTTPQQPDGGKPGQDAQAEDENSGMHTSLAAIQHALVSLKDNEPNIHQIYTLSEAIVASTPPQLQQLLPNQSKVVGRQEKRSPLQQQLEPTNNQYHTVQTDANLMNFLEKYNNFGQNQIAAALGEPMTPKPSSSSADQQLPAAAAAAQHSQQGPTHPQVRHLIYATPPQLLTHNLSPELNQHRLGLLHQTIFTTEDPIVFWLSYMNYYCHIAHHHQSQQFITATKTKGTRQHFLSYRRAVMLRQLRHRFPITLEAIDDEELKDVGRYFAHSRKKGHDFNQHDDSYGINKANKDQFSVTIVDNGKGGFKTKKGREEKGGDPKKARQDREARKLAMAENKHRRAVVGLGATVLGLAIAAVGYFWISSAAHQDDEEIEPTGDVIRYQYSKDHDKLLRDGKSKRRR